MYKRFLALVILSLSSSLVFADETDEIGLDQLPVEVIMECLGNLSFLEELTPIKITCKRCNKIASDPQFKAEITEKSIENKLATSKKLSIEEFNYLISHAEKLKQRMFSKMHENNIQIAKDLIEVNKLSQTDSPQMAYVALFLAKYVSQSAAREAIGAAGRAAARAAGGDAAWNAAWNAAWDCACKSSKDLTSNTALDASGVAAWRTAWGAAWNAGGEVDSNAAWNATKAFINERVEFLQLDKTPNAIGQKASLLADLYTMGWLIQHDSESIKNAFNAAYAKLDGSLSIEKADELINQHIVTERAAKSPFIIELKDYLDKTKRLLNEPLQNEKAMDSR